MNDVIAAIGIDEASHCLLADYFARHNLMFTAFAGHLELRQWLKTASLGVVLLDLQPQDDDSLVPLRQVRTLTDVPVIIMTASLDTPDRVMAFELGADDFVVKPLGLRELLARVRALLRRQRMAYAPRPADLEREKYVFNGWQLNRRERLLLAPSGTATPLNRSDFSLLLAFLDAPQRPLSREHLMEATRTHVNASFRSIDVQIMRLRRKLEPNSKTPTVITTTRGLGYTFTPTVVRL